MRIYIYSIVIKHAVPNCIDGDGSTLEHLLHLYLHRTAYTAIGIFYACDGMFNMYMIYVSIILKACLET